MAWSRARRLVPLSFLGLSLGCGDALSNAEQRGESVGGGAAGLDAAPPSSELGVVEAGAAGVPSIEAEPVTAEGGAVGAEPPAAPPVSHSLSDFARCGDAQLAGLGSACTSASNPVAIVDSAGALEVNVVSVVELGESAQGNRATLTLTPARSGTYALYLGTPNIGVAISAGGRSKLPICSRYLSDELTLRLTGAACPNLLGLYRVSLHAGTTYTIEFGPIAPERWVRVYLQADH